jgi:hypothetical protein
MRVPVRLLVIRLLAALVIVSFVACGGHPRGLTTSTPQHLYVGNDNAPGQILQYTLPITSTSTPAVTLSNSNTTNVVSLAVDSSGNLASALLGGTVAIFNAPITSSSSASATFNNATAASTGQLVYNSAGDLFATTFSNKVNLFTHPLSSASTPSLGITDASMVSANGATLDPSGNLFVSNGIGATGSTIEVFVPPYTGAPTVTPIVASAVYRKVAITSTQLFVANVAGTTGRVDVFTLPITASSSPAFSLTNGMNIPEAVAFDSSGNLYVGNLGNATVTVYTPPFSAASSPSTTLTVSTGPFAIFGIAIGK